MLRAAGGCAAAIAGCALTFTIHLEPGTAREQASVVEAATSPGEPAREPAHAAFPRARTQIAVPENNPLELYPPRAPGRAMPLTIALHGKDMDPLDMCEQWNDEGRDLSWLACPAGNTPTDESASKPSIGPSRTPTPASRSGAFDWGGTADDRLAALDAQLGAVDAVYGDLVDHAAGDVLVGFSRGSFLARDLAYARPGRFRGMVLLGAAVKLDADRLRAAGVRRVVLAAGDKDEAEPTMARTAARLAASGLPAKFVSLGPLYHVLPADLGAVMRDALSWVREGG